MRPLLDDCSASLPLDAQMMCEPTSIHPLDRELSEPSLVCLVEAAQGLGAPTIAA
jgi:hypothetical protein